MPTSNTGSVKVAKMRNGYDCAEVKSFCVAVRYTSTGLRLGLGLALGVDVSLGVVVADSETLGLGLGAWVSTLRYAPSQAVPNTACPAAPSCRVTL
jgi:hypothetical protein